MEKQLKWWNTLKAIKEQWVGRYTWGHRTYGVHSTQRAEAIHASISRFCSKSSTILKITLFLEALAEEQELKSHMEGIRRRYAKVGQTGQLFDLACDLADKLTGYAYDIVEGQAMQLLNYSAELKHQHDTQTFSVSSRKKVQNVPFDKSSCAEVDYGSPLLHHERDCLTSLNYCTCQFTSCWGLPCRHMFCVAYKLGVQKGSVSAIVWPFYLFVKTVLTLCIVFLVIDLLSGLAFKRG